MAKKRFDVEVPDGQHLGVSRGTDGAYRAHLFHDDTNELVGHAELFEVDEDEADPSGNGYPYYPPPVEEVDTRRVAERDAFVEAVSDALALLVTHYINLGVAKATPHVKNWWDTKTVPAFKSAVESARSKMAKTRRADRQADATALATFVEAVQTDSSEEVAAELEEDKPVMSSQEAQRRVVAALLARAFSDEQIRLVLSARIEDGDDLLAWVNSLENLTPQEIQSHIHLLLEANPSFLEEFAQTFLGGRSVNGQPVSMAKEEVREALRPADGEA